MPIFLITIVSLIILGIILSFFAKEKDKGSFVFIFVIISGSIIGGMMVTGVIAYFSVVLFLPLILVGYAIYWIINQLFLKLEGNDLNNSRLVLNIGFYFAKKIDWLMKYRGKYEVLIRISGYILIVTMFCPLYLIVPLIEHFSIFLFLLWIIPTIFWSCYVINEREINEMLNDR